MKNSNPWAFGLVFIMVFAYLAYNNFELPTIFIGETNTVTGKIIDIKVNRDTRGTGYVQNVEYSYLIDSTYYFDCKIVDKRYGVQYVGNNIRLEYEVNNPSKNKVLKFNDNYDSTSKVRFYASKKIGYYQIDLHNDMFYYTDFGNYGKIISKMVGSYVIKNDTLLEITPYIIDDKNICLNYQVIIDSIGEYQLIDIKTERVFK
jgi:hypothetical protein